MQPFTQPFPLGCAESVPVPVLDRRGPSKPVTARMPQGLTAGYFDEQGNACLKFHIRGTAHDPPGIELSGIIDTGFTGFIQLPIEQAFSLKLPLEGTAHSTLADDSSATCFTALGTVTYNGVAQVGVVMLEQYSTTVLIGMAFLRQFKLGLSILKKQIMLMNEDWLDELMKSNTKPTTGTPATAIFPSRPPSA
jgi:predicted aspartyl protease